MTKRKRKENEQSELQVIDTCLSRPISTNQGSGVSQTGSLPVDLPVPESGPTNCEEAGLAATTTSYVDETPSLDEVANEATAAALEGKYGHFWALLARVGYTI